MYAVRPATPVLTAQGASPAQAWPVIHSVWRNTHEAEIGACQLGPAI